MIATEKVINLNYILSEDNATGLKLESTYEGKPLEFIYGSSNMIPAFEQQIMGLKEGDSFAFEIKSDQAYGNKNPQAIVDLDINIFKVHDKVDYDLLKIGNSIPMQDAQGNRMNGVVLELNEKDVKIDFNHPLAGKNLFFKGEVLSIRDATEKELEHGHCHSDQSDGCGCGSGCGC